MKKTTLLLVLSALGLASCGVTPSTSETPSTNPDTQGSTNTTTSTLVSTEEEEEYVIKVSVPSNIQVTPSKTKAKEGEEITLTVTIDEGFELVSLKANDEVLTVTNGTASFVMPNRSVSITAVLSVTGDVTLQGGIVAVLNEETAGSGLYVARNIKVASTTNFSFKVGGQTLSVVDVDTTKCFASLGTGNTSTGNISIAGGATYDFYYDDNADPEMGRCYIKKVSQDTLPSDVGTLANLFDGRIKAEDTMNVSGVSSISYSNKITDTKYEYSNYSNGSSAKVTKVSTGDDKGFVSKKINGDVYSVVDSYVEHGENPSYNLNTKAYASRYGLVNKESDITYSKYQMSRGEAEFEAHKSSHGLNSLRFDIQNAYYVGFDSSATTGTEGLGAFDRKVTSTAGAKGFKVSLDSYREIDTTNSTNLDDSEKEVSYYLYDVDFSFDKAGRPLSGTYTAKKYGKDAYDFSSHTLTNPDKFTLIGNLEFAYTYGAVDKLNEIDDSMYLSSSISATFTDGLLGSEYEGKNALQLKSADSDVNEFMTLTSNAPKALDKLNYVIMASSNPTVIGPRSANEPLRFATKKAGKATLTIGNPGVPSAPKTTVEVEVVANITVWGFYMVGENGYSVPDALYASDKVVMEAGTKFRFRVYGTPKNVDLPFTITVDKPDVMNIWAEANKDGHYYINYDATKSVISAQTEIKVTINSAFYYEGSGPTVFTVTLVPGSTFSPVGTWYMASKYASDGTPTACDKNVIADIKLYEDSAETLSSITYKNVTYKFSFTINENTKKWTFGNKSSSNDSSFGVYMSETDNGYLGIALVEFGVWTGQETGTADTDILGSVVEDEESGDLTIQYQIFVPSSFAK